MKKKIFEVFILLIIPVIYYFLLMGSKTENGYKPKADINKRAEFDYSEFIEKKKNVNKPTENININADSSILFLINSCRLEIKSNNRDKDYNFNYTMPGTMTSDSGRDVLHAIPVINKEGWLCYKTGISFNMTKDELIKIKPVMRIKEDEEDETPIMRIEIIKQGEETALKSIEIKPENFKDYWGKYAGAYIDEPMNLPLNADLTYLQTCNQVYNYRIWWYGDIEVWFEKFIVQDQVSETLNKHQYDSYIMAATTQDSFDNLTEYLKVSEIRKENRISINYIMNIMSCYLQNYAK